LNNSSGGETLVLSDLADGTKLSAGTALSSTRWSVPGRDVDKAFIAAPENFSGSMQVTAKLYSSGNLALETKNVRFEWTGSRSENENGPATIAKGALERPDVAADGKDAIRSANRSGLISGHGTDASITSRYSQSSARGGVLGLSAADWVSQITFGQQPLAQLSASPPSTPKR
jgi:hypothetical protein